MKSFFQRLHDSQTGTSKSRTKDALYRPWLSSKQDKDVSKPTEDNEVTSKYQTVNAKPSQPPTSPYVDTLGRASTDRTTHFSTLPGPSNTRRSHRAPSMAPFQPSDPSTTQTRPLKPLDKPPFTSAIFTKRGDLTDYSGNEKEDVNRGHPSRTSRTRQLSNSAVPPQHQLWLPPDIQQSSSEKTRKKERKRTEEGRNKGYAPSERPAPSPLTNERGDIKGVDQKGKNISEEAQHDRPRAKQPSERLDGKDKDSRNYSQEREQEWRERERARQERREREKEKDVRRQQREDEVKRKEQQAREGQERYEEERVKEQREQERKERRERQDREKREREFQEEQKRKEMQEREHRERRHRERIERKRREEDERIQRDVLRKEAEEREKEKERREAEKQQLKEQREADKMTKDLLQRNLEGDPIQVDFLHTQRKRQEERRLDRELWEENLERMREERRNESSRNDTKYNDKPTTRTKDRIGGAIESDKDQGHVQDLDRRHTSQDTPLYPRAQDQMNQESEYQYQQRGQSTKHVGYLSESLEPLNKTTENMRRTHTGQAPIIPTQPQWLQPVTSTTTPQESRPPPHLPSETRPDTSTVREPDGRTARSTMPTLEQPQLLPTGSHSSTNTQPKTTMRTGVQDARVVQFSTSANPAPSSSMRVASQPQHKVPQDSRHHLSENPSSGDPRVPDTRRHPPENVSINTRDLGLLQNISSPQTIEVYSAVDLTTAAVSDPHVRGQFKRNDLPLAAGNGNPGIDSSRRREINYPSGTIATQRGYMIPETERPLATIVADTRTRRPLAQEGKYSPAFLPPLVSQSNGKDLSTTYTSPGRAGNEIKEETINSAPTLQTSHVQPRISPKTTTRKLTGPISNAPLTSQNMLPGLSEPVHTAEAKRDKKEKPILDSPHSNQSKEVPRHHRQHSEMATLHPGTDNSSQLQTPDSYKLSTESSQVKQPSGQTQPISAPTVTKMTDATSTPKIENIPNNIQHTPQHSRSQSADILNTHPQQSTRAHVSNLISRYENIDEVAKSGINITRPHAAIGQSNIKPIIPPHEPNNVYHDPRNQQYQSHPQIERPPSVSASRPTHDRAQAGQAIELKALGNNRIDIPGKPSRSTTLNHQLNGQNDTEKRPTSAEMAPRDIQEKTIQISGPPVISSNSIHRAHASVTSGTRYPERKESNEVRPVLTAPPPLLESNNPQQTDDRNKHLTAQHSPVNFSTNPTATQTQDQPKRKQDYENSPVHLRSTPSKHMNAGTEGADSERRSGMPRTEAQRQPAPSDVVYLTPPPSQRPPAENYTMSPAQISPSGGSSSGTRRHKNVQGSNSPSTQQRSPLISTDKESISPQRTGGSNHTRSEEETQPPSRIKHERLAELLSSSPLLGSDAPHQSHLQDARRILASKLEQQVVEPTRGSPGSHTNTIEPVSRSRGAAPGEHSPTSIHGDASATGTSIPSNQERESSRDCHHAITSTGVSQQSSIPDVKPTESHLNFGLPSGRQQPDEVILVPGRSNLTHHPTSIRTRDQVQTTTSDTKSNRRLNHTVPTTTTSAEVKARADDTHRIAYIPTTGTLYPSRDTDTPSSHKNGHRRQPSDGYTTEPVPLLPNRTRSSSHAQDTSNGYPRQPLHQQGSCDIPVSRTTSVPVAPSYTVDQIQPSRSRSAHPHQLITEREPASIPSLNTQIPPRSTPSQYTTTLPSRSTPSQSTYTTTLPPELRSTNSVSQPTTPKSYEIWLPPAAPQDDRRTQSSARREQNKEREKDRTHRDRDQTRERRRERDMSDRRASNMSHMRASSPARRALVPPPNDDPHIFSPFHYLKSRKTTTMSIISMQAQDGAASTVIGSPTSSMLSTAPIHLPPVQDPIVAAREWSKTNALVPGKRIRRPGLVWEDPEDPPLLVAEQRRSDRSRSHRKARSTSSKSREGSDSEPAHSS